MRHRLLCTFTLSILAVVPLHAQQNALRVLPSEQAATLAVSVLRNLENQGKKLPVLPLRSSDGVYAIGLADNNGPLLIAAAPRQPIQAPSSNASSDTVAMLMLRDMTLVNNRKPMPLSRMATIIPGGPVRITLAFLKVKADETGRTLEVYSQEEQPVAISRLNDVVTTPATPLALRWSIQEGRRQIVNLEITLNGLQEGAIRITPTDERDRLPFPKEGSLSVGDSAPDFQLKSPDGSSWTTLSQFRGKKPVVLIFGSYT